MPTHAVFSCVTPAYYMHGNATGQYNFTSWLGNNSKQGKLYRLLREIQGHMRLRISGDRNEVRQSYMQTLFDRLVRRFVKDGSEAITEIIELMDEYFLTREDFDSIIEISLGPNDGESLMKDVPPNTKTAFTRKYNSHYFMTNEGITRLHIQWLFRKLALSSQLKEGRERDRMWKMRSRMTTKNLSLLRRPPLKKRRILVRTKWWSRRSQKPLQKERPPLRPKRATTRGRSNFGKYSVHEDTCI